MTLDDRMRSAHKQQVDTIAQSVAGATFTPPTVSPLRQVAPALALVAVATLAFFGLRQFTFDESAVEAAGQPAQLADPPAEEAIEPPEPVAVSPEDTTTTTTTTSTTTTTTSTTTTRPTTSSSTSLPEEAVIEEAVVAPALGEAETPSPSTTTSIPTSTSSTAAPATTTTPSTTTSTPTTTTAQEPVVPPAAEAEPPAIALGVPSAKCPSGNRAELERAALSYIGANQGWGRLFNLVDEQDAEFEFEGWEPGFPDPVTVEIALDELVSAVDIRISQDPFTLRSGDIEIETFRGDELVESFVISIDGIGGWREHTFEEPSLLDRFRITRRAATADIMEVLVCAR